MVVKVVTKGKCIISELIVRVKFDLLINRSFIFFNKLYFLTYFKEKTLKGCGTNRWADITDRITYHQKCSWHFISELCLENGSAFCGQNLCEIFNERGMEITDCDQWNEDQTDYFAFKLRKTSVIVSRLTQDP